jgi:hypothetical protein
LYIRVILERNNKCLKDSMTNVCIAFIGVAMISCNWDLALVIHYCTTIFGRLRTF